MPNFLPCFYKYIYYLDYMMYLIGGILSKSIYFRYVPPVLIGGVLILYMYLFPCVFILYGRGFRKENL